MSDIFGGSKSRAVSSSTGQSTSSSASNSSSLSNNRAYDYLQGALGGQVSQGTGASTQMANMLGLNGVQGQNQGFDNWRNSTGYQFGLNQGTQAITGNNAAAGLLNSGSAAKALQSFGQDYANTQYGNYMNQLSGLAGQGLSAANTIGGAGNQSMSNSQSVSNSQSTNQSNSLSKSSENRGGIGGFVGSLFGK